MSSDKPSEIKCSRDYWTHGVSAPYTLKAEQRLDVLVGFDRRLSHAARMVFRFLLSWDMESHGNALASARFISAALKAQDPSGAGLPRSTVNDAINLLCDTGWITQINRGTGPKNASRYQPAWDALAQASRGEFPSIVANRPVSPDASEPSGFPGRYRPISPDASTENRPVSPDKDSLTRRADKTARTCSYNIPPASPAAEGGVLAGFSLLAATYDKAGDNLAKARKEFDAIAPDEAEQARMVKAAASWKATAKGRRMTLAKWIAQRRWMTTEEFAGDTRPTATRWPSCVVTLVRALASGGARLKYRDQAGELQTQQLDADELSELAAACATDRPACRAPSADLHELVGARFTIDDDGYFEGFIGKAAA